MTQQPEGVAFSPETFFDALHYYSNANMLRKVTDKMRNYSINGPLSSDRSSREKLVYFKQNVQRSVSKFAHPYMFVGGLFHAPPAGAIRQPALIGDVTAVEHITVIGRTRFNEFNPDFNFSRA